MAEGQIVVSTPPVLAVSRLADYAGALVLMCPVKRLDVPLRISLCRRGSNLCWGPVAFRIFVTFSFLHPTP